METLAKPVQEKLDGIQTLLLKNVANIGAEITFYNNETLNEINTEI